MNDFLSRTDPVASVASVTERGIKGARAVQPAARAAPRTEATSGSLPRAAAPSPADAQPIAITDDHARALAEYAQVHVGIESTVKGLGVDTGRVEHDRLAAAEQSLIALMPQPAVIRPLPPASAEMIEFVSAVTQSIVRQAALARGAQGGTAGVVDAASN